ncbi:MAG: UPF0175 family protein [Candidatus Paceibacterota bacterium]
MALTIPDEWLAEAGIDERETRVEIACRLYDAGRLPFSQAIRWPGLTRTGFEEALLVRGLSVYRPTINDLQRDIETLERLGGESCRPS